MATYDHVHLQCASAKEADDTADGTRRIPGERVRDHYTTRARLDLTNGAQGRRENILTDGLLWTLCYEPCRWLGLMLGTALWFAMYGLEDADEKTFHVKVDAIAKAIGDRGQLNHSDFSQDVAPAQTRTVRQGTVAFEPTLEPVFARAPAPRAPALAPVPARAPSALTPSTPATAHTVPRSAAMTEQPHPQGFSTSVQTMLPSAPPIGQDQQPSVDTMALITMMVERDDKKDAKMEQQRREMEAKMEQQRGEMERQRREMAARLEEMKDALTPAPPCAAISEEQLAALQARLEALHTTKLLSDEVRACLSSYGYMVSSSLNPTD
eukprot:COSAG02_NODE_1607_length_11715_cov_298.359935_6_plen_324_part_00